MINRVWALIKKDALLEFRQQHTFYGIILYVASTIFVLYLAMENGPEGSVWNSLFWIISLFVCVNTVAKSFLQESKGRMLYFYSLASPLEFILSKLAFNKVLMLLMSLVSLCLFYVFFDAPILKAGLFVFITILGGASISLPFTLMSAIAAKAQQNAALMAILGFPIILPLLLLLIRLSKTAFGEVFNEGAVLEITGLVIGLDVLIITLAAILFPFLWKD